MTAMEQRQRERAAAAGQAHVFASWSSLSPGEREGLLAQIEAVDFELVAQHRKLIAGSGSKSAPPRLEPPRVFPLLRDAEQAARAERARDAGDELLSAGKVGFVLVAGGQASRLGFDGPKGCFPVGPVSGRSLFEIHARRLLAAQRRHGAPTPWYVMTSQQNDAATRAFFEAHRHFGLDPADVTFFRQAMVPALDFEGRILMSSAASLFLAPNGHGGTLAALASSGALADARRRGVTQLSYFQVDNPLARPADALFLGLHVLEHAQMSSKVVAKRDAGEKVGVLGLIDGRMGCIEYSDLPAELRDAREEHGRLRFDAGNIAMHALALEFVERLTRGALALPWHVAVKKMTVWEGGRMVEKQGAKFETFVFDALALAERGVVLEVERAHEFSPVKNASGDDSPATTRADLLRLHGAWARAAGQRLPEAGPDGLHAIEVDPLLAEDQGEFVARGGGRARALANGVLFE